MLVGNALNKVKTQIPFLVTYLNKKHQFFETDETRKNPGFESAKPSKPEKQVLKGRP